MRADLVLPAYRECARKFFGTAARCVATSRPALPRMVDRRETSAVQQRGGVALVKLPVQRVQLLRRHALSTAEPFDFGEQQLMLVRQRLRTDTLEYARERIRTMQPREFAGFAVIIDNQLRERRGEVLVRDKVGAVRAVR